MSHCVIVPPSTSGPAIPLTTMEMHIPPWLWFSDNQRTLHYPGSYRPARVNYMTLFLCPGVGWLSSSPTAPGRGVNITRQREVSLDASTKSSSSGTSMSISSNSKLKAAFTWAGHTTPAVALFSRPTRLSSSRSARVIFSRRWQPAMAHLTGTLLAISPILQRQFKVGFEDVAQGGEPHQLSPAGHSVQPHDRRTCNAVPGSDP